MSIEIPDWYVLKDPGETSVDAESWNRFATTRLQRFIDEDLWSISKPSWMEDDEWYQTKVEEMGGHLLLRLAVAKDPRLTSWLVEVEGDLFEFRFMSSPSFEQKITVLEELYDKENVKTIQELDKLYNINLYRHFSLADVPIKAKRPTRSKFGAIVKDLDRRIAVKFYKIPSVVSAKKVLLFKGWGIVKLADIRLAVKREFEKQLKNVIEKSKELVESNKSLDETVKPIREKITEIARQTKLKGDFSSLGIGEGEDIFSKPELFPPCILELISILKSKGHLSHVENWQLGTFLKKAGMTVEDQQRFWYNNSVDNVGTTFDEFKRRIGYQIKHMYGEVGGGIDYSPPSCKTCINGYFCYWAHKKLEDISEDIKVRMKDRDQKVVEIAIEDISKLIINQRFQDACGRYFTLLTGWKKRGIAHMLSYTEQAIKRFSPKKDQKEEEKEDKQNE
ncbi:MAG: hypothetical protein ACTSQF_00890 [Candidatus Heimdallarchaeaceae archaeon]